MSKTPYKKWYEKNKEQLNAKRREKYHSDPVARAEALKQSSEYRAANPPPSRVGASRMKVINGVLTETFRISEAAKAIGRSIQTIRIWEEKGIIPPPSFESSHRFYTQNQILLMMEIAEAIAGNCHSSREVYEAAMDIKCSYVFNHWSD